MRKVVYLAIETSGTRPEFDVADVAVAGLDGNTVCLEPRANFIGESSIIESFLSSLDNVWSTIFAFRDLFSDIEAAVVVFTWLFVFPGLMFVEDGDWQTMEEFGVDDGAAVEHEPASVAEYMIVG